MRGTRVVRTGVWIGWLAALVVLTSGCGLLFGGGSAEEETPEESRVLVPTFTPTAEGAQPIATDAASAPPVAAVAPPQTEEQAPEQTGEQAADAIATATPLPDAPTPEATAAEPTAAPPTAVPKLV